VKNINNKVKNPARRETRNEIRCPPDESQRLTGLFVFKIIKGIKIDFSCWTSDLAILDFNLARKLYVARSGFQQQETNSTSSVISKTNSDEMVENQRAEARPLG